MKMQYIILGLLLGFLGYRWFSTQKSKKALSDLKATEAKLFLVDVREPSEFSAGSVNGAVNIPLGTVGQSLDKFKGKDQIVVFCKSGMRSSRAAGILKQNGITNVINGGSYTDVAAKLGGH